MVPVPLLIYSLVFAFYMVSQYFTSKYLRSAIKASREELVELGRLIQILKDAGVGQSEEDNRDTSIGKRPDVRS